METIKFKGISYVEIPENLEDFIYCYEFQDPLLKYKESLYCSESDAEAFDIAVLMEIGATIEDTY